MEMLQVPHKTDGTREYRFAAPFEVAGDEGSYIVEGYATTFDVPYQMEGTQTNGMPVYEVIDRTALDNADTSDVIFQYDHHGMVFARTRNATLQLEADAHGYHVRADLSGCEQGRQLYEGIRNGLIDRMSWGFTVPDDGWEYDAETRTSRITRVGKVYDVSAVSMPANQNTEIHSRSYIDGVIDAANRESVEREEALERAKATLRTKAAAMRIDRER